MDPLITTFAVLIVAIVLFLSNRLPAPIVALLVTLALFATGAVTFEQAIAGFGDPIVIYLAGLFVVSESLEATGVTAWAGQQLTRRVGDKRSSVLIALMLLSALLTALISVNGAVAALVPVGVALAARAKQPPSQLLLPLAFAAHAGSLLTMLGTPINVLVSELSVEAGDRAFGFFEFAIVGVPLLVGVVILCVLLGPRLLPHRAAQNAPNDLSAYAETIAAEYALSTGDARIGAEEGVVEVVIPPRSPFLGAHVFSGMRTASESLLIAAVHRGGYPLDSADLQPGDVLVVRGAWSDLESRADMAGVISVESPDRVRRQSVSWSGRATVAVSVLAAMCMLLATGLVPPSIVVIGAGVVLVATRILTIAQAQRSISLSTLVVVAGMIPLSTAIQTSGAADLISDTLLSWFGGSSPTLLLAGIVVVVLVLGQFISNLATVLIVAPIAIAVAHSAHVSPLPMMMAITIAGAASFLTPVATPGNLMVQEPGGYRFGDYWKLGLPCLLLFGAVAVFVVPLVWRF
ncbi:MULTISPECIES: SLC13 family permease [unclassified Microbacterium]|uniref:SLC13 family permease n=1 Tax=unclassified Microbacterium TaxID=2609290 RepID=UPI003668301E